MANPTDRKPFRVVDEYDNFLESFSTLAEAESYMARHEETYLLEEVSPTGFRQRALEKLTDSVHSDAENMECNGDLIDGYVTLYVKDAGFEAMTDEELAAEMEWRLMDEPMEGSSTTREQEDMA